MTRGIVALVFRCNVVSGHLTVNHEVSGFQWATPGEVKAMADEAFAVRVLDGRIQMVSATGLGESRRFSMS